MKRINTGCQTLKIKSVLLSWLLLFSATSFSQDKPYVEHFHKSKLDTSEDIETLKSLQERLGKTFTEAELERMNKMLLERKANPHATNWYEYIYAIEVPDSLLFANTFYHYGNLKHNGAHALGDIYLEQEKHQDAAFYFRKALQHPYRSAGGSNTINDNFNLRVKLVTCYQKLSHSDSMYLVAFPALFTNTNSGRGQGFEKMMIEITREDKNKAQLKLALDKGLNSLSHRKKKVMSSFGPFEEDVFFFYFNNKEVELTYSGVSDPSKVVSAVKNTLFYQCLSL